MAKFFSTVKRKVGDVTDDIRLYWNRPKKGEYISYKETVNYSMGGFTSQLTGNLMGLFAMTANAMFLAFVVGIRPTHIVFMGTVMTVIQVFYTFIRAKLVDNTRTKWGRFRPYIATMGVVSFGVGIIMAFLPFSDMAYFTRIVWIMGLTVLQGFAWPLFNDSYNELRTVMSPNSNERAKLFALSAFIWSLAPTITGFLFPLLADIWDEGFMAIEYYRLVIVPISAIGIGFSLFTAFGCKERVVVEKKYSPKVDIMYGCFLVYKNKYWWINSIRGWLGFAMGFAHPVFLWLFMFRYENLAIFAILVTIQGTAATVGMVTAPWMIKKLGSVRLTVLTRFIIAAGTVIMWMSLNNLLIFFLASYIIKVFADQEALIVGGVLGANVKDYTQYQTGKRLDFTFGAAGQIFIPITLALGLIIAYLNEAFGFTGNANIFFDPQLSRGAFSFFGVLLLFTAASNVLNAIPLFFFDLNETKHRQVIAALKLRALYKDHADNDLTPHQIKETVEQVRRAKSTAVAQLEDLKPLRKFWGKLLRFDFKGWNEGRKRYIKARNKRDGILSARLLLEEMAKFDENFFAAEPQLAAVIKPEAEFFKLKVALAERLVAKTVPVEGGGAVNLAPLAVVDPAFRSDADAMPFKTLEDKKHKLYALWFAGKAERMAKKISKRYPDGVFPVNAGGEFDRAALYNAIDNMPVSTKEDRKARRAVIKQEEGKEFKFNRAFRHLLETTELLAERDRFLRKNYQEIEALYDGAVAEVERQEQEDKARREREAAEKLAERERLLAERRAAKYARKGLTPRQIAEKEAEYAAKKLLKDDAAAVKKAEKDAYLAEKASKQHELEKDGQEQEPPKKDGDGGEK